VKSIDFDPVASYYDLCVETDLDVPFWIEEPRRHPGHRLELMCDTGRLSLPCCNQSVLEHEMWSRRRVKLRREHSAIARH
jgi:hypothetical protein